jgi:tyrosyl-tRNA synthetase
VSDPAQFAAQLERNAVDSLPAGGLETRLKTAAEAGRPLRVKLGIDPTAPDIHLGHTVVLSKLREFQDAGHQVVLILGDYTARVGDPSGRSKTRPELSPEEIDANAATFQEQAFKVLDKDRVEVRRNSEWLDMSMMDLFKLMRLPTVAQLLEREDFANRYSEGTPIALLELLYPLLQAYDSVAIESDVELGGTDQKFNLLLGRDIQTAFDMPPQIVMTLPILPGTDGVRRMGKSLGNHIGVTEPPEEIFGKVMSIPDEVMPQYYDLLLGREADPDQPPVQQKRTLARELVARFHSESDAEAAEAHFDRLFKSHDIPEEIEDFELGTPDGGKIHLPAVIADAFGVSRSEARRTIQQGGTSLDGQTVGAEQLDFAPEELDGRVLKVGKRRFKRLRAS